MSGYYICENCHRKVPAGKQHYDYDGALYCIGEFKK